jgi:hypothetical protein
VNNGVFTSADVAMGITRIGTTLTGMSFLTKFDETGTMTLPRSVMKEDKGYQQELYNLSGVIEGDLPEIQRMGSCSMKFETVHSSHMQQPLILQITGLSVKSNNKNNSCSSERSGVETHLAFGAGVLKSIGISDNNGRVKDFVTTKVSSPLMKKAKADRSPSLAPITATQTEKPEMETPASASDPRRSTRTSSGGGGGGGGSGGDEDNAIRLDDSLVADEGGGGGRDENDAISLEDSGSSDDEFGEPPGMHDVVMEESPVKSEWGEKAEGGEEQNVDVDIDKSIEDLTLD